MQGKQIGAHGFTAATNANTLVTTAHQQRTLNTENGLKTGEKGAVKIHPKHLTTHFCLG